MNPGYPRRVRYTRNTMWAKQKGFTIVELLIVIVVIAILAAITVVAYNGISTRARDSSRVSTMVQLKKSIENHYAVNGSYPTCSGNAVCVSTVFGGWGDISQLVPNAVLRDPRNSNGQYGYYYARGYKKLTATTFSNPGTDQEYIIGTRLENSTGPLYTGWDNSSLNFLDGN